jgi:5-hydroxyisourate hydrolase
MISTHILDLSSGTPAEGVTVSLEKKSGDKWSILLTAETGKDGRIAFDVSPVAGIYQLCFQLDAFFKKTKHVPFFIQAPVIFQISDLNRKYHIPLLLSPYGYSTYRGS